MSHTSPTSEANIIAIVKAQRAYFKTGATRSYQSRFANLHKLKAALQQYEAALMEALHKDLGKPEFEAYVSEVGFSLHDVSHTLSSLKSWMKPKCTLTSLLAQPATSRIYYEPLGVNLIIAPYNYPINLTFSPLIAELAAGNTAVIKTSELTPHCSAVVRQLIEATFPPELVAYIEGAVPETTVLLQQKFDHIFFTGSPRVGSIVMSAAAKHLTPVTLELGGKSPCIVHDDAKLDIAVNRIVSGKFMNAGQTCIAPDYVLVHEAVKEDFLTRLKARILAVYGDNPIASPDFGRIISDSHFQRISGMIDPDKLLVGGQTDASSRFIAPTVLRDVTLTDKAMSEEIFGPVLPVLSYQSLEDIQHIIEQLPQHPLACYVFSESSEFQQAIINSVQFGGGCINNCLLHTANHHLPFGGVGESGIGAYHGKHGFERFSHQKPVLKSATWMDASLVYAPYGNKINWLRRFMK
jgi:aldehyde dehydrogenase (NAD+)